MALLYGMERTHCGSGATDFFGLRPRASDRPVGMSTEGAELTPFVPLRT